MKLALLTQGISLILALVALASCTSDPNKLKHEYLASGEHFYQQGKYQEAVIQFRNALDIDPRLAAAHLQLGRTYLALKNRDAAYREINESATLDPSNSNVQLELASVLLIRGQLEPAQSLAKKVLASEPGNAGAHKILAEKEALAHDFPQAIQEFQKTIELEPQRIENYQALGATLAATGKYAEAEDAYRRAIQANPKSPQAHISLGEFYFSQKNLPQAESEMREACGLDPQAVPPWVFLARIYMAAGKSADAEKTYADLKTVAPKDPQAYRALGIYYLSSGQREKALAEFRSILSEHPKDNSVKGQLVELLLDLNRVSQASSLNQDILTANQADPQALLAEGRIFFSQGQYEKAKTALSGAIKGLPLSALAYYFLGLSQQATGLPDLAKSSLERALELQPQMALASAALANLTAKDGNSKEALQLADHARQADANLASAYVASAQALMAKGDAKQAEAALLDALRRDPASLTSLSTLVKLYSEEGRAQEALYRISGLIQLNPQNPGLRLLQGLAYLSLKDLDRADSSVRRALTLDPNTPDAYTVLADIHFARGATADAKSDLRAAIAARPRSLLNYMALATQFEKEGNWEEARRLCEKAHEIDPSAPIVADELAFLYLEHGGDVNAAVSLAQVAKQKMPDSPITADTLGWAYYKLGSLDSALVQLRESSAKVPNNPIYHYHLGMAYMAARQLDLARQSLRSALKTDPQFPYAANARAALEQMAR